MIMLTATWQLCYKQKWITHSNGFYGSLAQLNAVEEDGLKYDFLSTETFEISDRKSLIKTAYWNVGFYF